MLKRKRVCVVSLGVVGNVVLFYLLVWQQLGSDTTSSHSIASDSCGRLCYRDKAIHVTRNDSFDFSDWESSTQSDDVTTGNFTFPINPRHTCTVPSTQNVNTSRLVIMVISKADNFILRYTIRKTWGTFDKRLGWLLFMVGYPANRSVQEQLVKEANLYGDIVQANVPEVYNLLTNKSKAMLEWFNRYCRNADYYFKVDDDIYVDVANVYAAVSHFANINRFFFCFIHRGVKPVRNKRSKYFVSRKIYSEKRYPPYCAGPAYVMSADLISDLYKASLHTTPLSMEDVFITGVVSRQLRVTYIHSNAFWYLWFGSKRMLSCAVIRSVYSIHQIGSQDMLDIFSYSSLGGHKCDNVSKILTYRVLDDEHLTPSDGKVVFRKLKPP